MLNEQLIDILQGMDPKKKVKFRIGPLTVADIHGVHVVSFCKEVSNKPEDVIVLENASLKKGKYESS
jgi:hypothetical protein